MISEDKTTNNDAGEVMPPSSRKGVGSSEASIELLAGGPEAANGNSFKGNKRRDGTLGDGRGDALRAEIVDNSLDTMVTAVASSTSSGRIVSSSSNGRPAYAEVFDEPSLMKRVASFQDGQKGATIWNGDDVASAGHLNLMIRRHSRGAPLHYTHVAMSRAAKEGSMDVVRWLHDNTDVEQIPTAMDAAAAGGHLEVTWCSCRLCKLRKPDSKLIFRTVSSTSLHEV